MKKIILIVGASGVGKDTLLRNIKDKVKANFVKRYITRKPDKNESNYYLDKEAFEFLDGENYFISKWKAHENNYGIAATHLKKGLNIISISRGAIRDFEEQYDAVTTINITVPKEELYRRLKNRERETEEQIAKRIERSYPLIDSENLIEFDNSAPIEKSSQDFINLIESIQNEK